MQTAQYRLSVDATCALARAFVNGGCDVAIDDVFEPDAFDRYWLPQLDGLDWKLVIVRPSLAETRARLAQRPKRVRDEHVRVQHERSGEWGDDVCIDTTGLDVEQSLALALPRLEKRPQL